MEKREKAIKLIEKMRENNPYPFLDRLGKEGRGIQFILTYLNQHENEEVIASDLSRNMGVSTARISVLLKKMEEKGLIEKNVSNDDNRRVKLALTDKGRKINEERYERMINEHIKLIDEVGEKDLETFIRIADRIKQTMESVNNTHGGHDEAI